MLSNDDIYDACNIVKDDLQIMDLGSDCYWTVIVFSLAHEMAHAYFASIEKRFLDSKEEEFEADAIAYDIVLKIIIDQSKEKINERLLEEYSYLAPMMYMDYFDLYYYTDWVLYQSVVNNHTHPSPIDRKERLFAIVNKDE